MPIFEDDDLERGKPMPDELKEAFLAKKERQRERREAEIAELEEMFNGSEEPGEMDRPDDLRD